MDALVKLAKEFDQLWRMYIPGRNNCSRRPNTRAVIPEQTESSFVSATLPMGNWGLQKKLTQDEWNKCCHKGHCLYCGQSGHWQDKCPQKCTQQNNPNFWPRPLTARATLLNDAPPEKQPPKDQTTILRTKIDRNTRFYDHLNPDTALLDFYPNNKPDFWMVLMPYCHSGPLRYPDCPMYAMYSGSKNCPNVWLFCKDWLITNPKK